MSEPVWTADLETPTLQGQGDNKFQPCISDRLGAPHTHRRGQIHQPCRECLLPAGRCAAMSDAWPPSQRLWEASLTGRRALTRGRLLYRRWPGASGLGRDSEYLLYEAAGEVRVYDFRTRLVRDRNQEPSKHKDSFVTLEFMGTIWVWTLVLCTKSFKGFSSW